jgi:hypothetical protein
MVIEGDAQGHKFGSRSLTRPRQKCHEHSRWLDCRTFVHDSAYTDSSNKELAGCTLCSGVKAAALKARVRVHLVSRTFTVTPLEKKEGAFKERNTHVSRIT